MALASLSARSTLAPLDDVKHAVLVLVAMPDFTVAVVASLALGIARRSPPRAPVRSIPSAR